MVLGKKFAQFVEKSPISVMMRGIVEYAFDPKRLNALFEETREKQYTRTLQFSTVADLMSEVVFNISPSIGAAYQANQDAIPVSRKSAYNKLNHMEPSVSAGLVSDSATRLLPVVESLYATRPPTLRKYNTKIVDGNHFAATEHRIGELRTVGDAPLPGKALVVFDQRSQLATHVVPCEDGHAQERSLFPQLLFLVEPRDLWIADRNFCTAGLLFGMNARRAKFLIRQHAKLSIRLKGERKHIGKIATGRVYEQEAEVANPQGGAKMTVRRITVELYQPTEDGDLEIHIVTNVPQSGGGACKLAETYADRWTIEIMFHELTETLTCEIKTLGYPKAAVFAFCLAVAAYNGVSVIKAALRAAHGSETVMENVSPYYLSLEIAKTYTGMMIAIPEKHWEVFREMSVSRLAETLRALASDVDLAKYQKHPRGPKKPKPERIHTGKTNHASTARILARRNA